MPTVNNATEAIKRTLTEYDNQIDTLRKNIELMERQKQTLIDARNVLSSNYNLANKS